MMIATIHQPHFFPWLGYFNKLCNSDIFVILDDVKYKKLTFTNRTFIKDMHGDKYRLSVPVIADDRSLINQVKIQNTNWQFSFFRTIEHSYSASPYFGQYWKDIKESIKCSKLTLLDLNMNTLQCILQILQINVHIYYSSQISCHSDRSLRIIDLCKFTQSNAIIFGEGGSLHCHDINLIEMSGIKIYYQQFANYHPKYLQLRTTFIKNLSILDLLFNVGHSEALNILKATWNIHKSI